jgi:protease-4
MHQEAFKERFGTVPKVALISLVGDIVRGASGNGIVQGQTAGSATIANAIGRCADDRNVKAIVMRLDTPGGDAIASDLIWGELSRAAAAKPVVISVADVCASGGYYVAAAADQIVIEPTSITGSIGVYAGKANLSGLYDKLGLSTGTLRRGEHAGMFSLSSPFSADERLILRRQLNDLYDHFVELVATSRGLASDSVDAIARGRVWSGARAIQLGLADSQGSLLDAINEAANLAQLQAGDYEVVEVTTRGSWFAVPELVSLGLRSLLGGWSAPTAAAELLPLFGFESGAPQYRMPYELRIR